MAIIPYQNMTVINGQPVDPQALLIYWGPFQAGDEGQPISVYAYHKFAWQLTGYPIGGDVDNLMPISPDRSMTVHGSNDRLCWGPIFTLNVFDPSGMQRRTNDPLRCGAPDGAYLSIKPKAGGSLNPAGPDCGFLLFCAKQFGPRT